MTQAQSYFAGDEESEETPQQVRPTTHPESLLDVRCAMHTYESPTIEELHFECKQATLLKRIFS